MRETERETHRDREADRHTYTQREREREIVRASPGTWCLPERLVLLFQIMFC